MKLLLLTVLFSIFSRLCAADPVLQVRGTGHCVDQNHDEMDYECLQYMWDFYHLERAADSWAACGSYLSSFSTKKYPASNKCLVYQSKCNDLDNDKPCCKSIHCHIWLMGRRPS